MYRNFHHQKPWPVKQRQYHSGFYMSFGQSGSKGRFVLLAAVFCFLEILPFQGQPMPEMEQPHHTPVETKGCDDYIKIYGSTNINHFHFVQNLNEKTTPYKKEEKTQETLTIKIPAHNFEPSNPMMYKDFLKFIKANEYPYIDITIFFDNIRLPAGPPSTIVPKIKIGLAGRTHTYKIPGYIEECRDKKLHIRGKVDIDLKDFGLEPPTKFMGMVKVNNEVFINFGLTLDH